MGPRTSTLDDFDGHLDDPHGNRSEDSNGDIPGELEAIGEADR